MQDLSLLLCNSSYFCCLSRLWKGEGEKGKDEMEKETNGIKCPLDSPLSDILMHRYDYVVVG